MTLPWLESLSRFGSASAAEAAAPEPAYSDAVKAVRAKVGEQPFQELLVRLRKTNSDIQLKGLKTIRGVPNAGGTFSRVTLTPSSTIGICILKISTFLTTAFFPTATLTSRNFSLARPPTATSIVRSTSSVTGSISSRSWRSLSCWVRDRTRTTMTGSRNRRQARPLLSRPTARITTASSCILTSGFPTMVTRTGCRLEFRGCRRHGQPVVARRAAWRL